MLHRCADAGAHTLRVRGRDGRHICIDIHCHCTAPKAAKLIEASVPAEKRPQPDPNMNELSKQVNQADQVRTAEPRAIPEVRIAAMDRMGVDIQVLSPTPAQMYYWTEPELGRETSRLVNDRLAEICATYPDRFVGLGTIPMQAPDLAIEELERAVKTLGLRGIEINTSVGDHQLSAEKFRKIFARIEELGVMIFLHPFSENRGDRRLSYWHLNNMVGNPLDSTIAVSHLIFGGVLDAYPGLKICVAHGGGFLGAYPGRWDHAYSVRPDARETAKHEPSYYLKQLYYDTIVYTHPQLEALVKSWGTDHILLGTDFPADMSMTDPVCFVEEMTTLSRSEKDAILGGNAARLLKLDLDELVRRRNSRSAGAAL